MSEYKLKTGKVGDAVVGAYKKIEDAAVSGYKEIEKKFVDAFLEKVEDQSGDKAVHSSEEGHTDEYRLTIKPGKVGNAVLGTYKKIETKFVDAFLEKVEDPKDTKSENSPESEEDR